ncbi:hypothetical protein [Clostridium estertheticum]|uniref:ABC-2 transporter permease n=1 Tax=Clostridium estertheticum TaxID=238834 RepID=A0A7Y3STA4_9CLOT|nr:hypothetical protein [Clostridium estertheticum]NNU74975.1 hypothetical protein [Clostridium estertheticum]WBL47430.1 hypothetical protein LOR37_01405 [Clostridium estertheticum]
MDIHSNQKIPVYDEKKMIQTIDAAKKEYRKQMLLEPMNSLEFLFQQMLFLSKKYWLTQLVVFFVATFSLGFMNLYEGISENKVSYYAIYASLLIVFSIPELWKNISTNTYEVENTTYFDLRKLYLSRLVLVGMLDLILVTILTLITVHIGGFSLYDAVIYFFVPFNFNCCICFSLLWSKRKICSELLAVGSCISGAGFWYLLVNDYHVYELLQMRTWYVLLILSLGYLIFAGKRVVESSRCYLEVC